jgi:hypothetical protein
MPVEAEGEYRMNFLGRDISYVWTGDNGDRMAKQAVSGTDWFVG